MKAIQKQPDNWIERAPHQCTASLEIAAAPADIWGVLADHESWPEWFAAVKNVNVTGPAAGVGATRRVQLSGLTIDEEFVTWDAGERYAFTAAALSRGTFTSLNERITIEDLGNNLCTVTYTQAFAPAWWFRIPFRLAKPQFRRNLDKALNNLAQRARP